MALSVLCDSTKPDNFDKFGYCYSPALGHVSISDEINPRRGGLYCDKEAESNQFISHVYGNACGKLLRRVGIYCGNKDMGSHGNNKGCFWHDTGMEIKVKNEHNQRFPSLRYSRIPVRYDGGSTMDLIPGGNTAGRLENQFHCPPGSYADGLEFISGDWIDSIRYRCRPDPLIYCQIHPETQYCTKWFRDNSNPSASWHNEAKGVLKRLASTANPIVMQHENYFKNTDEHYILDNYYNNYCAKPENEMSEKCACINADKQLKVSIAKGMLVDGQVVSDLVDLISMDKSSICWWKPCQNPNAWVRSRDVPDSWNGKVGDPGNGCMQRKLCRADYNFMSSDAQQKLSGFLLADCRPSDTVVYRNQPQPAPIPSPSPNPLPSPPPSQPSPPPSQPSSPPSQPTQPSSPPSQPSQPTQPSSSPSQPSSPPQSSPSQPSSTSTTSDEEQKMSDTNFIILLIVIFVIICVLIAVLIYVIRKNRNQKNIN